MSCIKSTHKIFLLCGQVIKGRFTQQEKQIILGNKWILNELPFTITFKSKHVLMKIPQELKIPFVLNKWNWKNGEKSQNNKKRRHFVYCLSLAELNDIHQRKKVSKIFLLIYCIFKILLPSWLRIWLEAFGKIFTVFFLRNAFLLNRTWE